MWKCSECPQEFMSINGLMQHETIDHSFTNKSDVNSLGADKNRLQFACPICGPEVMIESRDRLDMHYRQIHPEKLTPIPGKRDLTRDYQQLGGGRKSDIEVLTERVWEINESKGWNENLENRSFGDWISLFHTEVSEMYEEYRCGIAPQSIYFSPDNLAKPEGIPIEIADLFIRMLHFCKHFGIDLEAATLQKMEYNATRPYRHGGKVV